MQNHYRVYNIYNDLDSFQNGVDTIYNSCTTYGSTPTSSTPNAIVTAISNIYTNRYNSGYNDGYSTGKSTSGPSSMTLTFSFKYNGSNPTSRDGMTAGGSMSHTIDVSGWNTLTVNSNSNCSISKTGDISLHHQ